MRRQRFQRVAAMTVAGVLMAGACTEGDDDATTTGSDDETEQATPSGECPAAPADAGDAFIPEAAGPADDSLDPIAIGFVNADEGFTLNFPGSSAGFDAGVEYVNNCLGGIGGHPIEARHCNGGGDAASTQACAQELGNDESVDVFAGGFVIVSDPLYPVLEVAGKTINLTVPLNAPDFSSPSAVSFFPGNPGISAGLPVFAIDHLDAKKIAVVVSNNDAGRSAAALVEQVTANDDVEIVSVPVADTEVDYTGPINAAGAADADVFIPLVAGPGCVQVANALDALQLDVPVISTTLCADPAIIEQSGGKIVGWYIGFNGVPAQVEPGSDVEADFYNEAFAAFGEGDGGATGATTGFGVAVNLWQIGNEIGADNLSPESWDQAMRAFEGAVFMGPRQARCGANPTFPSLCASQSRVFQITAEGLEDATDGEPIDPLDR